MICILCNSKMSYNDGDYFEICDKCDIHHSKTDNCYYGYCTQRGIINRIDVHDNYYHIKFNDSKIRFFNFNEKPITFEIKNLTLESLNELIKKVFKVKKYI